jgi:hypothetical protein
MDSTTKYFTFLQENYTLIKNVSNNSPVLWTVLQIANDINLSIEIIDVNNNPLNIYALWDEYKDKFFYINVINNTKIWKAIKHILTGPIIDNSIKDIEMIFINSRNNTKTIINNINNDNNINVYVYEFNNEDSTPWTVNIEQKYLSCITGDDRIIINIDTDKEILEEDILEQNKIIYNSMKKYNIYLWFNINNIYSLTYFNLF